jgi:transcriptional regulator with XRE-family HTH domain
MAVVLAEKQEALLGLRVLTRMHRLGLSIPQLARAAHLPLSAVQKICAGRSKQPSVWTIWALAQVLGVSMDFLCGADPL